MTATSIRVKFTAKGHPEQNATHEQHHRVLKADTLRPPTLTPPRVARQDRSAAGRQVHRHGEIVWEGRRRFIGDALAGHHVALLELHEGGWSVRFFDWELGHLHQADPGAVRPAFHIRSQKLSTM